MAQADPEEKAIQFNTIGEWVNSINDNTDGWRAFVEFLIGNDGEFTRDQTLKDIAELGKDEIIAIFKDSKVKRGFITEFVKVLKPHFAFTQSEITERQMKVICCGKNVMRTVTICIDPKDNKSILKSLRDYSQFEKCDFYATVDSNKSLLLTNANFDGVNCVTVTNEHYDESSTVLSQLVDFGWFFCQPTADGSKLGYEEEFVKGYHSSHSLAILCLAPIFSFFLLLMTHHKVYGGLWCVFSIIVLIIAIIAYVQTSILKDFMYCIFGAISVFMAFLTNCLSGKAAQFLNDNLRNPIFYIVYFGCSQYVFNSTMSEVVANFAEVNAMPTIVSLMLIIGFLIYDARTHEDIPLLGHFLCVVVAYMTHCVLFVSRSLWRSGCRKDQIDEDIAAEIVDDKSKSNTVNLQLHSHSHLHLHLGQQVAIERTGKQSGKSVENIAATLED